MSNLVIVAIPDENDRVWKVSSEKIPHLTLLHLGDSDDVANLDQIMLFAEHAANTTLRRFYLPVDRRGELGDAKADVLFFKKGRYDYKAVRDFRVQLLKDDNIRTANDSVAQFEGPWNPHLTLGYPDKPAKPDATDRDFGFYDVGFNKIAVWVDNYDGPEFLLKDYWDEWEALESVPMDVAMSDIRPLDPVAHTSDVGAKFLAHYGVRGMKWGERKVGEPNGWLDPSGREVSSDISKAAIGVIVPVVAPLTIPAQVRLIRGGARALKARSLHKEEQKFEKVAKSQEGFVAIHNGAAAKINRDIGPLNAKHPGDLTKDSAKQKAYDKDVTKLMQDAYRESANSLTNKRGTKHVDLEFHNDGMDFTIKVKDGPPIPTVERVKHAAEDEGPSEATFKGKIKRDATGHIVGLNFDDFDQVVEHSAVDVGAEFVLEHVGVKGMRWGVRKEEPAAVGVTATSVVPHGARRKTKIKTEGGENHPASQDAVKVAVAKAKLRKSGTSALSNQELQELQTRMNLERNVSQLVGGSTAIGRGRKFVKDLTGANKEFNETIGTGIQSARLVKQVR